MRGALVLMLLVTACGSSLGATGSSAPSSPSPSATVCEPTTYRDTSGVVTANGTIGIVGDASTSSDTAMYDYLVVVRRGAQEHEQIALEFHDIGHTSPATWVSYRVVATARSNPWGDLIFQAGWKPIGFAGSCWRLIADGEDTGLILEVRP